MSDTLTVEPNDLGYYEIDHKKFKPMGDRVLVQWEHSLDEIAAGKLKLIRPDTFKKLKFTGLVIAVGPDASPEIKPGVRLLFDQFSDFQKFWDPKMGRMALLSERQQGSAWAIIPLRAKVQSAQGDYNYDN